MRIGDDTQSNEKAVAAGARLGVDGTGEFAPTPGFHSDEPTDGDPLPCGQLWAVRHSGSKRPSRGRRREHIEPLNAI
jgi:hypothetical protein